MSLGAWMTYLVIVVPYTVQIYLLEMKMMSNSRHSAVEIVVQSVPFMTTFIPIVILYVLNIANLRRGISSSNISISKAMSTVLAVIICIYLLTNIPGVTQSILKLYEIKGQPGWLMHICWILNYSSNPFVYFLC